MQMLRTTCLIALSTGPRLQQQPHHDDVAHGDRQVQRRRAAAAPLVQHGHRLSKRGDEHMREF